MMNGMLGNPTNPNLPNNPGISFSMGGAMGNNFDAMRNRIL